MIEHLDHIVESYVIIVNFALVIGALILAAFFFFAAHKEDKIFRPMAWREVLLLLITLYSIFADNLLRHNKDWWFIILPPYRPAIYRTPIVIGTWIVIFALWKWLRKRNDNGNG